jgi:lincosamide nucleotidyltransferase A/C/D/E
MHVIEIDHQGDGIYGPKANGEMYPAASLTGVGNIGGQSVGCISAEWALKFHGGYELKEKDFRNMTSLCKKFNLEVPDECKQFQQDRNPQT